MQLLQPPSWPRPKGYSNGVTASGTLLFTSGLVGWDKNEIFQSNHLVDQVHQALLNTKAVLQVGGAQPEHIARMVWYITDRGEYLASLKDIGQAYRQVMGLHFPAMSVIEVNALMEVDAKVEIETTAVIPSSSIDL